MKHLELNNLSKEDLINMVLGLQDKVDYMKEEIGYLRDEKLELGNKINHLKEENDKLYNKLYN